jgi:ribosomal protein S18 acetylase RimI-like enzyme
MNVRPASRDEIPQVVEIHLQSFPGFFLTFLGRDFLRLLYQSIYEDPKGILLAAVSDVGVEGFAAGVTNQVNFYQSLIARRKWRFAFSALRALIKRPGILFRLVRALHQPAEVNKASVEACLMSIAVRPESMGNGVGKRLVTGFCRDAFKRGVSELCLTTDRDNNDATNKFYLNLNFRISRSFITREGRAMNEYVISLPLKD